jgi:hypothetical protein
VRRIEGAGFGTLRLGCAQARVVADTMGVFPVHTGTWCSGITSALHAEGPGFNPQCVHLRQRGLGRRAVQLHLSLPNATTVWPSGLRRWLKAPVRKGVGSNPTAVIFQRGAGCLGGVVAGQRGTLFGHMV